MRAACIALILAFVFSAVPARAAPLLHRPDHSAPRLLLARGGCGIGWHPYSWRDRWGVWHRRCVPNRW